MRTTPRVSVNWKQSGLKVCLKFPFFGWRRGHDKEVVASTPEASGAWSFYQTRSKRGNSASRMISPGSL
jgi:hypothetical protein